MTWWEAIILGLLQALTEFIPVSSSAHVRVFGELIGAQDPGAAFTAIVQIGSEVAVIVYFRRDIARIVARWFGSLPLPGRGERVSAQDPDARMGWLIIIGSVPIVILGVLFADLIETGLRHLYITAATLVGFGVLLGLADKYGAKKRPLREMTWRQGLLYGLAQALALIPGVSRAGGTITAGLAMGFTREAAARYSFLLGIPAVMGSGLFQLVRSGGTGGAAGAGATLLATAVALVVSYVVIVAFLKIVSTFSYMPFVYWRYALAGLIIVLVLTGAVPAEPTIDPGAGAHP